MRFDIGKNNNKYNNRRYKKLKISLLLLFMLYLTIPLYKGFFNEKNQNKNDLNNFTAPNLSQIQPNSKPLLIYQHSTITNTFYPLSLPSDISFRLLDGWTSKNVTITYDGVSHQKDWVINGTFDTGEVPWEYFTTEAIIFEYKPWVSDYIEMDVIKSYDNVSKGSYGYFEENITISEPLASNTFATLSMDYFYELGTGGPVSKENKSVFISIGIGGFEINKSESFLDLNEELWTPIDLDIDLTSINQQLPDNATIRAGVFFPNETDTGGKTHTLRFDNIQFSLWTKPNIPNLLIANDTDDKYNYDVYNYTNSTYGKGSAFIDESFSNSEDSDIIFTISKNDTFTEDFTIYNITITSEAVKAFNSTIEGQEGSRYANGIGITWLTESFIFIPYNYLNNWVEITKPNDWNITSILNGFGEEKVGDCTGTGFGSEKLIIPKGNLSSGLWKIEASSKNYISTGNVGVKNGLNFIKKSSLTLGDIFQINVTLNNETFSLTDTQLNLTIEYPNGSIFLKDDSLLFSNNTKFGNYTVGNNMSIGTYQVILSWTNNQSYLSRDKVGFIQFDFDVWHHTNLIAINSYEEKVSGEPFLMKVNFTDFDSNTPIDFATITYNSTLPSGASGTMVYFGSGIYVADMDLSGVDLGDYYFSFNTTNRYFENHSLTDLIHLKIINQSLIVEVPHEVIHVDANSYAGFQINIIGAISNTFITGGVNITTDWNKEYTVTDHLNGSVTLNLSTDNIPLEGIIKTYTVTIFANKVNYGSTSAFISITVHPIPAVVNVNTSIVDIKLHESFSLKMNYTVGESNEIINEAILNVSWVSSFNILSSVNNFIINFSTADLSLGSYVVRFRLNHPGYETAFESVYVTILPLEINVETITFNGTIDIDAGGSSSIRILLTEDGSGKVIENANVTYSWHFLFGGLFENKGNGIYEMEISIPESAKGAYTIDLTITTGDAELKNRNFSFNIYVSQETPPNYLFIGIVIALLSVVGVLGTLSLRSYVIVPRKRKKERIFQNTIQVFKDVKNIQAVMFIQRSSGMPFFNKNYAAFNSKDNFLLSGFIQAITLFGEQMISGEMAEDQHKKKYKEIYSKNIIELNFKFFHLLICDYQSVRSLLILREQSSERLKKQFYMLSVEIDAKLGNKIEKFKGKLEDFEVDVDILLNNFLSLYLLEPYKLIEDASYMQFLKKGRELQSIEVRILNVIIAKTKFEKEFTLIQIVEEIDEKNVDKIYGGLHTLIGRNIIVPTKYKKSDLHPLLGRFK